MQNKELDLLFENINKVIRQIRDLQEENFEAGIVDSVTSNCEYLFGTYEELLSCMETLDYKIEREVNKEKWNFIQLKDLYTDLINWKMPNNLDLDEEDKKWLRILLKNFTDDVESLVNSLHTN